MSCIESQRNWGEQVREHITAYNGQLKERLGERCGIWCLDFFLLCSSVMPCSFRQQWLGKGSSMEKHLKKGEIVPAISDTTRNWAWILWARRGSLRLRRTRRPALFKGKYTVVKRAMTSFRKWYLPLASLQWALSQRPHLTSSSVLLIAHPTANQWTEPSDSTLTESIMHYHHRRLPYYTDTDAERTISKQRHLRCVTFLSSCEQPKQGWLCQVPFLCSWLTASAQKMTNHELGNVKIRWLQNRD